jgi:hypothetical protein
VRCSKALRAGYLVSCWGVNVRKRIRKEGNSYLFVELVKVVICLVLGLEEDGVLLYFF